MLANSPIADENFREIKKIVRTDNQGRLMIGQEVKSKKYRVLINDVGQILLDPIKNIPERELWLWKNHGAFASLERGLKQAASREVQDLGSFAQYGDLEIDD